MRPLIALIGLLVSGFFLVGGAVASAHVLPTTTIALNVHSDSIDAGLEIPTTDLEAASGIDLSSGIDEHADEVLDYLADHFRPSTDGQAWIVEFDAPTDSSTEDLGTGIYDTVDVTAHLVPPTGVDEQMFDLGYDAVIDRVVTHTALVTVRSDWASGSVESAREIGTISLDTVTGKITPLIVRLDDGSAWQGFLGMTELGISHIREGTDHQLFLLTLLLPAPLMVASRRWSSFAKPAVAVRRIAAITASFTLGHSATLALGTLGLPVPQQSVEVLIAASVLVAAVHAVRPVFPRREALIAGLFGLVHGMAFSATLTDLDLTGSQLAISLLGFNVGIEIMQLVVVALVLPPLIMLARTRVYSPLRITAAVLTALAAVGWVFARIGVTNPVASAADRLVDVAIPGVAVLWCAAIVAYLFIHNPSVSAPHRLADHPQLQEHS